MAKKGEKKAEKRFVASKARKVKRKEATWSIRTESGPHTRGKSVPLGSVLRDYLEITKNLRETKIVLSQGKIFVDGTLRKNYRFPVGLFDLISVSELNKKFRVLLDRKGRLTVNEIDAKSPENKLCRVVSKKAAGKGKILLCSHDGRSFVENNGKARVGDTLKVSVPGQKVAEVIGLEEGNLAFVTRGKHSGEKAKIKEIIPGTIRRKKMVSLKQEENEFKTIAENVFVVGKKKPEIELGESK